MVPFLVISSKTLEVYFSRPLRDQEPLRLTYLALLAMSFKGCKALCNADCAIGPGKTIHGRVRLASGGFMVRRQVSMC